ncbi:integrase [Sphingopyxis bauzanensis]|uniref:Integrase n=2 Tax=Sphingopyxis bauzanensis TaxID=651663 RepID=A0A246JWR2_9SPHN|nr:integrase [Sphingopyxis bauzanensis]
MGSIPNTIRRGGIFYFRRAVPVALQRLFNRSELTCSLRTADVVLARRLSRCLYVCSEELFDAVRTAPMLSDEDIAALVKDFYSSILAQDETVRLMRDDPIPEERRTHYIEHYRQLAERSRIDLANSAFGSVRSITSTMLARRFGQDVQVEKMDARRVSHAMLRAGIEVAEALKARAEGDFSYEPKDKLLVAVLQGPVEPPQASVQPSDPLPIVPPAPAGPPFSEEAETFREAQLRRKVWEQQTGLQARKTYALFAEYFGDRPLANFTRRDAARFKELLEDLPANYGKAAEYRGVKAEQVVERSKSLDVQRLSPRTVQRHFAALASLWASVIEHGRADTNIFADWKFAASKRARDQRQMWEKDELEALFSSPVWTGCQSANRRSKPGSVILRDEKFWLPLIAVFSGMRQEEICQLRLTDVRQVESIWIFDLNMRTGQQLKNANAIRQVPVHAELIRLGFLTYADEQRKVGKDLLFANLQPGGADDRLGHNYSKWFSRYRRETGLFVPGRDFHSFRHSATTFMSRASVQHSVIDAVTGHATAGETARYDKGLTVSNLKEAIDTIEIGVDLSRLYVPA